MDNNEVRVLGYCVECGNEITDEMQTYYCNEDGECLCSTECLLEHYNITKIEV